MESQKYSGKTVGASTPDQFGPGGATEQTGCAHPLCDEPGPYRAPRSRDNLNQYYWFCLEHIREYNAAWNYYAGMDDAAIERALRDDSVWRRPTWPLGARSGFKQFRDPLNLFTGEEPIDPKTARAAEVQLQSMTGEERKAMAELGLEPPVSRDDLKVRYKILAKTLHPDANGGDKRAEERLKSVNHAYKTLRDSDRLA